MRFLVVKFVRAWTLLVLSAASGSATDLPLTLTIRETGGVDREGEVIHNGIPLSRDSGITDVNTLAIQGVPAQFEVLSRWGGALNDTTKPIQWLQVTAPAIVNAGQSGTLTLVQGGNAAPTSPLLVTQTAADITINTGPGGGKFVISKTAFSVFKEVRWIDAAGMEGPALVNSEAGRAVIVPSGQTAVQAAAPGTPVIEHQGPLFVTIKIAGSFSDGGLQYIARYSFRAGSPVADLDFYYAWIGSGSSVADSRLLDRVYLSFPLALGGPVTGYVSATDAAVSAGPVSSGQSVSLAQRRRAARTAPPVYEMQRAGAASAGGFAERPFVAIAGSQGGLGASIQKMKFYEPQSLVAEPGLFTVNVVDEPQWIGPNMGAFARMGIAAIAPGETLSARNKTLALLDHPLIAWPSQAHVAKTKVFGDLWDGTPDPSAAFYAGMLEDISDDTLSGYSSDGTHGFMTHGLVPRYWSNDYKGKEFYDRGTWDGYFLNSTFTDYHSAFANPARQFAMTNAPGLLHDLSFPAARRQVNSLVLQNQGWGYMGYGGYRSDANSSHSYFENMFLYYYLTGDRKVVETLQLAGSRARNYRDASNGTDRVTSQMANICWFLGHATDDDSYIDAFRQKYRRAVSDHLALLTSGGREYAFFAGDDIGSGQSGAVVDPGVWMQSLYLMNDLWTLSTEYGDESLGTDAGGQHIRISRLFAGLHRTLWDYASTVHPGGDGTAAGRWAHQLLVQWTGPRIGGQVQGVQYNGGIAETYLWDTGKAILPSVSLRAAALNPGDPEAPDMRLKARQMFDHVFRPSSECNPASNTLRWDKVSGECFARTHGAVALMANAPVPSPSIEAPARPRRLRTRTP